MRLIDADALIEEMSTVMDMQDTYLPIHFKEWLIDEAPTIEPKCGEWIDFKNGWKCNACGKWNSEKSNFCPNCGADMRGENNETDKEMR